MVIGTIVRLVAAAASVAATAPSVAATAPNGRGCQSAAARSLAYCDEALGLDARLRDLSGRLTVDELASRLQSGSVSAAIDQIGLPAQNYRIEAVHGLEAYCIDDGDGRVECPTYFPAPQGVAATFNRSVFADMGRVVAREARLWTNRNGLAKGRKPVGPSVRCPMVNLMWVRQRRISTNEARGMRFVGATRAGAGATRPRPRTPT